MTDEVEKQDEKVVVVLDPTSVPIAAAKKVGNAIVKSAKKTGNKIKKAFGGK